MIEQGQLLCAKVLAVRVVCFDLYEILVGLTHVANHSKETPLVILLHFRQEVRVKLLLACVNLTLRNKQQIKFSELVQTLRELRDPSAVLLSQGVLLVIKL